MVYRQRYPFTLIRDGTLLSRMYDTLEEYNYNKGQLSNIPLDVHASVVNTDGQLRNILSDMELIDTDDQVRKTLSDEEPIDMEYLLGDNQRVVNFLAAGTQEDKQRFIDLLFSLELYRELSLKQRRVSEYDTLLSRQ